MENGWLIGNCRDIVRILIWDIPRIGVIKHGLGNARFFATQVFHALGKSWKRWIFQPSKSSRFHQEMGTPPWAEHVIKATIDA